MQTVKIKICNALVLTAVAGALTALVPRPAVSDVAPEIEILQKTSKAFAAVAREAMPAVVFIRVEKTVVQPGAGGFMDPNDLLEQFFGLRQRPRERRPERRFRQQGQGTGFIVTEDGYILTNNHIVADADRIIVTTHDGSEFQAELIGSDAGSEVALIKIPGNDHPVLPLGDSDQIEIGEWVIAIGNPFGLSKTLTVGVVSAKGRSNIGITDYEDFIQTDAAINPGNSGGPLLSIDGRVVGINTAIFSQMGGSLGIGFAIPINMAVQIKEQLMERGKVARGYLGVMIQDLTADLAESFNFPERQGVLISDVVEDGAAAAGGVQVGDIVIELNGRPVQSAGQFRNQVAMTTPGTPVKLTVWREGARVDMSVTVKSRAEGPDEFSPAASAEIIDKLGFSVEDLTEQWSQRFGYEMGAGVLITRVSPDSKAASAGLRPGQLIASVNHVDVGSVAEFNQALGRAAGAKMILLRIRERGGSRFVVLSLE